MLPYIATILIAIGAISLTYRAYKKSKWKTLEPLLPACYNFGKRRDTFRRSIELMSERGAKNIIETGVAREGLDKSKSDGASTIVFGLWAKETGARLTSVDISANNISEAKKASDQLELESVIEYVESDSVSYLESISGPVDMLYLDSYDYDKHDLAIQKASQEHHLKEFKAIESRLHEKSIVLIDDCKLPGGGKGKQVVQYMLSKGWKIEKKGYQTLLTR
ncbi:MAG: class I SAM-dependent methyltransferase [Opitutales bacterium]